MVQNCGKKFGIIHGRDYKSQRSIIEMSRILRPNHLMNTLEVAALVNQLITHPLYTLRRFIYRYGIHGQRALWGPGVYGPVRRSYMSGEWGLSQSPKSTKFTASRIGNFGTSGTSSPGA